MKVSQITNKELADYLKLDYFSLTDAEKLELDTLLSIAKSFIKSYTGLEDLNVENEVIETGDGIKTTFYLENKNAITNSQTLYVDGVVKDKAADYVFDGAEGKVDFLVPPALGGIITGSYKTSQIDNYEDFVIVVYILAQDMYDNRTLYIEKNNLNKVVDTILGMHSVNLL